MIRESNAPKAYIHKTDYEKTVNIAALHAGKPIRRIMHTNDIYPEKQAPTTIKGRVRGRNTEKTTIERINLLMRWMAEQDEPVTLFEMEDAIDYKLHNSRGKYAVECSLAYLLKHGYIKQVIKPAKGRKSAYVALKEGY